MSRFGFYIDVEEPIDRYAEFYRDYKHKPIFEVHSQITSYIIISQDHVASYVFFIHKTGNGLQGV